MQHELKGNKQTVVSERLVKRKYDYRWVTSKKTVYTCVSGFGLPQLSAMKPHTLDRSQLPVESIYGGSDISDISLLLRSEDYQSKEVERMCYGD